MARKHVVISGIGVVSSIGIGRRPFAEGLRAGRSGVGPIRRFDASEFPSGIGGEVAGFSPEGAFRRSDPAGCGRSAQMAVVAAAEALADAGLSVADLGRLRSSVAFGTTDGECQVIEDLVESYLGCSSGAMPEAPLFASADMIAVAVAREFGTTGDAIVIPTACAAGNYAIGHAHDLIRSGAADVVLCGGVDSFSRKTFAGFTRLGAVAPERCQPFDRNRKGIIPGEGAAVLVVEDYERARARGASIHAEILGYGLTCDARHMVSPDSASIARCMSLAHAHAGISAADIDYICAHGTGTPTNDVVEAGAIRSVFGTAPPTSSIKSMIGHTMGAASAIASAACCIALNEGFAPPTINFEEADPRCDLDCVPNVAKPARLGIVQNNGFAFGGNNAVVILSHGENLQ